MHPALPITSRAAASLAACLLMGTIVIARAATAPLTIQRSGASEVEISWFAIAGLSYQLQTNNDLSTTWVDFDDPILGTGSTVSVAASTLGTPKRFFRLKPPLADTITASCSTMRPTAGAMYSNVHKAVALAAGTICATPGAQLWELPACPHSLCATDSVLRDTYLAAFALCRDTARARIVAAALVAYNARINIAQRLRRKEVHVGCRVAVAFYSAMNSLCPLLAPSLQLIAHVASSCSAGAGSGGDNRDAGVVAAFSMLQEQFGVRDELPLAVLAASTGAASYGELVLTSRRLAFVSHKLSIRARVNILVDNMLYVV
ncbi:MAG: hypothetical protein EOP88_20150 [Verrucomicrobiaceae bacterium]|nr:MAG: hypothetical protein EOP88_20150 [Verrucomicrobiaceae bacterium]